MDKFLNYRNYSSVQGEDVPVTPDANTAIAQGDINTYVLTANVHKAITIPSGAKFAVFGTDANIWVRMDGTAAIPVGDTTDGTGAELNPAVRYLGAASTIGVISASAAKISIMFYT
jgi:hypothetical protein